METLNISCFVVVASLEVLVSLKPAVKGEHHVERLDQIPVLVQLVDGNIEQGTAVFSHVFNWNIDSLVWKLDVFDSSFEVRFPGLKRLEVYKGGEYTCMRSSMSGIFWE